MANRYDFIAVVISGLVLFTITTFYTDIYKQPHIQILPKLVTENDNFSSYDLTIINDGRIAANDFRLTLKPTSELINYSDVMSPEKLNFTEQGSNILIVTTSRLPPGVVITINLVFVTTSSNHVFNTFATYKEGTLQFDYYEHTNATTNLFDEFTSFFTKIPLSSLTGFLAIVLSIVSIIFYLYRKKIRIPHTAMQSDTNGVLSNISEEPIEVSNRLNPAKLADSLSDHIQKTFSPFSIGIIGNSGSGKTTLMRLVKNRLDTKENIMTIWLNAWRYESEDHFGVIPLLRLIMIQLKNKNEYKHKDWKIIEKSVYRTFDAYVNSIPSTSIKKGDKLNGTLEEGLNLFKDKEKLIGKGDRMYYHTHFTDFFIYGHSKVQVTKT